MPIFHGGKGSGYHNNVSAANAEEYCRRSILLPFINNMISQLKLRLSFSTLRRLKTYLRSTMHKERLSALALLNSSNVSVTSEELNRRLCCTPKERGRLNKEQLTVLEFKLSVL
ncbi:uncharacterized protein LOC118181665 [Stegodyphus dumicola]|uniref:uncharacterized protein LOC118181665 n=1 Tax=Stegodyphus dumicola TaxID=202533 RepID=UPI0015A859F5|nr:uncharacterized protein LOC118181665 [Stegodyphus dumicola]